MYIVLLIGSIELTGSIYHNSKEAFSTENEAFSTKLDNISKKIFIHCLVYHVAPYHKNVQVMALFWTKHGPSNWFFLSLKKYAQGCFMPNF